MKDEIAAALLVSGIGLGSCYVDGDFSKRIRNAKDADMMLIEERSRLLIPEDISIHIDLDAPPLNGFVNYTQEVSKKSYRIVLNKGNMATVRHELFHIADGHFDVPIHDNWDYLRKYYLSFEPRAKAYSLGWKF